MMRRAALAALFLGVSSLVSQATAQSVPEVSSWPQLGGPDHDFQVQSGELAVSWSDEGPPILWQRPLGDGYSSIVAEGGRLYTMYREADEEVVVSLEASSGETIWEHRYEAPYLGMTGYGTGPRSTPLLAGDRVFAVGVRGRLTALDRESGTALWVRDLWDDLGGNVVSHGYSSSPVAFGDLVILPVGAPGASLVAFDQASGEIRWQAHDFRNSYSSPMVLQLAGKTTLIAFMSEGLIGVAPSTGRLLFHYPFRNQFGTNISLPTQIDGDTLVITSIQTGARGLRFRPKGDLLEVEELWSARRVQLYHAAAVSQGDWFYGSTGTTSPAFLTAVNARTGEIGWRLRGFAKANCLAVGDRLLILDEDGILYLATATSEELVVHAETQLLEHVAWTVPTVLGSKLYARDRRSILAVDLG